MLRLKGGDPFVFGRGAEEALALARASVPFRIVPGITAGIGGLAYAGIPLTHRDINHAVTFVTGHGADGKLPKLDWAAIARGSPTIVLYMARKYAGEIAAKLIDAGRDANEPAAVVSNASFADQTVRVTRLAELGAAAAESAAPAILVVGENVKLRDETRLAGRTGGQNARSRAAGTQQTQRSSPSQICHSRLQFAPEHRALGFAHGAPARDFVERAGAARAQAGGGVHRTDLDARALDHGLFRAKRLSAEILQGQRVRCDRFKT